MNQVLTNAFVDELEKLAITQKLVRKARDAAIGRARDMAKKPGYTQEITDAYLTRKRGQLSRIKQMADQRSVTATKNMMSAARGSKGTHAIPEYVRGGGARDLATLERNAATNARMKGISNVAEEGILKKNLSITRPQPGERVMGKGGRYSRPLTTTDSRGKKTTKWVHAITDSAPSGRWPAVNPEFSRSGLMKDAPGKKIVRDALTHYRSAPAWKLDVKSGMKKVDADALRRSRGQIDTRGRTLPAMAAK